MPDLTLILHHWSSTLDPVSGIHPLNDQASVLRITTAGGGQYVLKAVEGTAFAEHIADRLALLRYLSEQGTPVAAPVPVDADAQTFLAEVDGRQYWLSPYLPADLDSRPLDWPRFYANTGAAIGRLHRALAGFRGPVHSWRMDLVNDLHSDLSRLREVLLGAERADFERAAGYLAQRLPGRLPGLPAQTIHGDCHGGNIVWEHERVAGFIDLDHLPWGPRVYDLGYFLADMAKNRIHRPAEIEAWFGGLGPFVRGYQAEQELSKAEITILPAIMLVTQVRFASWFLRQEDMDRVRFNLAALYWLDEQAGRILAEMAG